MPSYILDFEDAEFIDQPEEWTQVEYRSWELARKQEGEVLM